MNINIKQIFTSDLDPNSTLWWGEDKVDKINHNFRQFELGGAQGPQGYPGSNGSIGYAGSQGYQGAEGYQGSQGHQGSEGIEPWKAINRDITSLFPKYNNGPAIGDDVRRVSFSDIITSDDSGDNIVQPGEEVTTYNGALDWNDTVLNIFTPDPGFDNIELVKDGNYDLNTQPQHDRALITLDNINNTNILEIFSSGKFRIEADGLTLSNYELDAMNEIWLNLNNTEFNLSLIDTDNTGAIDGVAVFQQDLTSKSDFKYNKDAQANYILTADNTTGETSWKNKLDVFDGMPIGTIVSIPSEYFNSDNFYLDETLSSNESNQTVLNLRWGSGKESGPFIGWYVCGGMTWEDETNSYDTPNLNSFSYQIDPNGSGQLNISGGDNNHILLAGAKHYVDASYTGSNTYNISTTLTDADENIDLLYSQQSGGYYRSKNIHIVYLGVENMKWSDSGVATSSPTGSGGGSQ